MKVRSKKKRRSTLAANAKRPNPLRVDPTRTATLRRQFEVKIRRQFSSLKARIIRLVEGEDALALKAPTTNTRWRFNTSEEKLRAFREWLRQQFGDLMTGADEEQLWRLYVEAGYRKGAGRAFDDTRGVVDVGPWQGSRDEFLRQAFGRPVAVEKVKLLASRTFEDLANVTADMSTRMGRVLADGLVTGAGPRDVARQLVKEVGLGQNRALAIARTELIRAHSEGALDALEDLGVEEVGVMVEWTTTPDAHTCPLCSSLQGIILRIEEARGMIPRHVSCRCTWVPANVGERRSSQTRGKGAIDKAIRTSESLAGDEWGPAEAISARRPQAVVNAIDALSRFLLNTDCGTGAGGFKPGNTCGKGGQGGPAPAGGRVTDAAHSNSPTGKAAREDAANDNRSWGREVHATTRPGSAMFHDHHQRAVEERVAKLLREHGAADVVATYNTHSATHEDKTVLWAGRREVASVRLAATGDPALDRLGVYRAVVADARSSRRVSIYSHEPEASWDAKIIQALKLNPKKRRPEAQP